MNARNVKQKVSYFRIGGRVDLKEFDKLSIWDFNNGSVLDDIRNVFKSLEKERNMRLNTENYLYAIVDDLMLWRCKCGYFSMKGHVCYHCGQAPSDD